MGGKRHVGDERRFWSYVNKTDDHWLWTGYIHKDGHGKFWLDGKHVFAHRYSWFLATGKWPDPQALHKCNEPSCVKKDHLYEGTRSDNKQDADKARWVRRWSDC